MGGRQPAPSEGSLGSEKKGETQGSGCRVEDEALVYVCKANEQVLHSV